MEQACEAGSGRRFSRRWVLVHGGWAAALGILTYQVARFLGAPSLNAGTPPLVEAGELEAFAPGENVYVPQARAWVRRHGESLRALDAVCPHLGCIVRQAEGENGFYCPCHGSRFAPDGSLLEGPAAATLRELRVEVAEGQVFVRTEGS